MKTRYRKQKSLWFMMLMACTMLILLFQLFFSQSITNKFSRNMEEQKKHSVSKMVHMAYNSISPIIERVRSGEMGVVEGRKAISDMVRAMTYADEYGSNYIFMSSYDGIMMVQPFEPEKEGSNQWELKDDKGTYIIQELVKAAKEKPEGSYVSYYYYLPQKAKIEEKLSYVMGIPEMQAYIGTGMYVESSYLELKKILDVQRYGFLFFTIIIFAALMVYVRILIKGNNRLMLEIRDRKTAEETLRISENKLQIQYKDLQDTQEELQTKHDELSSIYEELTATEEELRKQYEELQKSQNDWSELAQRYMLVLEASNDLIWDRGVKDNFTYFSSKFKELFEYPEEGMDMGIENIFQIVHEDDRERLDMDFKEHVDSKTEFYSTECRVQTKDGSYKWFMVRGKAVVDDKGEIIHNVGAMTDIEERKQHEEEIKHMAYFDYLTGLSNRVRIVNHLNEKLSKCSAKGCNGSIFFIDVDNFKVINDTFGHFYGDRVLIELANKLNTLADDNITIGRIGGDEFIVVQDEYKEEHEIKELAEQILTLFSKPIFVEDNNFDVTCSIGVAMYPKNGTTVEEVLKNADLAMYKAKNKGKNKFVFYDDSIGADLAERMELEKHLKDAFEKKEFQLYYQPQVDTTRGAITGFEALIRWVSPIHGVVSPGKFIPIAEEMGLINELGKWVIDESFAFARNFMDKDICVSCNISSIQLIQSSFVQDVTDILEKYGLKRGSVALELTESSLIESLGETTEKLSRLREKGIAIYLDDFGTGYSSLTYLKNLPIDIVKIDKSFTDNIVDDDVERSIVKTIVSLAHEIGLQVVAEGVETEAQRECLKSFGCNYIQGYLISKPVPKDEVGKFII